MAAPASRTGRAKPTPRRSRTPRHAGSRSPRRFLQAASLALTAILAFSATGAVTIYADLQSQLNVDDVDHLLGTNRPTLVEDPDDPYSGQVINLLVMGTDYRDAENEAIAGVSAGMRSDTTMIVHISGDRSRMEVVSIPRDSLVDIPACNLPDGSTSVPRSATMFNDAFSIGAGASEDLAGAAACTIQTVERLTNVPITSHVVLKMTGVIGVVDAIGGVRMCFPEPIKENPKYGTLDLPEGEQTLDGRTAINFLRARHGQGMGLEIGSDLTRIERQQAFLDAASQQILEKNLITDSRQLYSMIKAVLASMNTSRDLGSPSALAGLAFSLRDIDMSEIVFTSVPVVDAPNRPGRVMWTNEAAEIWERLILDEPPVSTAPEETASAPGATTGPGAESETGEATTTDAPEDLTTAPERDGVC